MFCSSEEIAYESRFSYALSPAVETSTESGHTSTSMMNESLSLSEADVKMSGEKNGSKRLAE